jgi:hypothetical protein
MRAYLTVVSIFLAACSGSTDDPEPTPAPPPVMSGTVTPKCFPDVVITPGGPRPMPYPCIATEKPIQMN